MFTIYYNNGLFDECDGTLDEAKAAADEGASYTQCDISIEDENREFDEDDDTAGEIVGFDVGSY